MDRNEKLQFQQSIENYFESKHIYDLFEKLLKELVVNKPSDPIEYLIKRLKIKDNRKIFITGAPGVERKKIALTLAEHFLPMSNFLLISISIKSLTEQQAY